MTILLGVIKVSRTCFDIEHCHGPPALGNGQCRAFEWEKQTCTPRCVNKNTSLMRMRAWHYRCAKWLTLRTTTHSPWFSSNSKIFYPAPWLDGNDLEQHPVNIWYWVREQNFKLPRSCLEVQLRGVQNKPVQGIVFGHSPIWLQVAKEICGGF